MASEKIERLLYSGEVKLVHNPKARGRTPRYLVNDTIKPKGVTTILGATLAKDFVEWALSCMEEYLEEKLPIITTADLIEAKKEAGRRRDSGAGVGTETHMLVEQYLKEQPVLLAQCSPEAQSAFAAFVKWFDGSKPSVINVEEVIYSREFGFAGTYDCMLKVNGKVMLGDLKTTNSSRKAPNGVYAENFLQLGGYALAHEEQRIYEKSNGGSKLEQIEGLIILSAKKDGKFDAVTNEDMGITVEDCMDMFRRVVNLFTFMGFVTSQLGGK